MFVLIADSDAEHRLALTNMIAAKEHLVSECLNANNLITMVRKKFPDLIFLSSDLSGVSGLTLLKQLRGLGGHAVWNPIVLMGDNMTAEEMLTAIEVGADDCFNKPLSEVQLHAKVASAMRMRDLKEEVFAVAHELAVANRAMEGLVTQDVLTGLTNSNGFEETLERSWFKARKEGATLALIMLDIDYLAKYNKTYGAEAGDKLVCQVAKTLQAESHDALVVARTSGGTFTLLFALTQEAAISQAEHLMRCVEALAIPHQQSGCAPHVTLSAGVSVVSSGFTNPWDLVEAADYGLYQAKHQGRRKVCYEEIEHNS